MRPSPPARALLCRAPIHPPPPGAWWPRCRGLVFLALLLLTPGALAPGAAVAEDPPPELPAPARDLRAEDPWVRARAVQALRDMGPEALPLLDRMDDEEEPDLARVLSNLRQAIVEDWHRAHLPEGMVYLPAGLLRSGVQHGRVWEVSEDVTPVAAFYLDRTEVTVGAWRAWLDELGEGAEDLPVPSAEGADDEPVAGVLWEEASRFARARGGRLPTLVELEYATRGSGTRPLPWGYELDDGRANLRGSGPGRSLPVGSFPRGASPCGALDLIGNVAEWTSTEVPSGRVGHRHPVFGGSYASRPELDLALERRPRGPDDGFRDDRVGFRVARDPPPLP